MDNKTLADIILKNIHELEDIIQKIKEPVPVYQIDIDLALSKVRNLYNELLSLNKYSISNSLPVEEHIVYSKNTPDEAHIEWEVCTENTINEEGKILSTEALPIADNLTQTTNKQVLAETFKGRSTSLNDIISQFQQERGRANHIPLKPVHDIKQAMSVNDRVMIINQLFESNASLFVKTIDHLHTLSSFDESMLYLKDHFTWDEGQPGFRILIELIYRKFT